MTVVPYFDEKLLFGVYRFQHICATLFNAHYLPVELRLSHLELQREKGKA
jgi:hypothetical protein